MNKKSNNITYFIITLMAIATAGLIYAATCPDCKGSGKGKTCWFCKGSGLNNARMKCAHCSGTGSSSCTTCSGRGTVKK
ncbi:hypothetical protein HW115_12535 [Verrucomicrobiaceae bacterium N1E253]|uniref:Uncharacterized protein n=1 Tax=Oceaniferula marina TaxID=2748318 RepID=A0A851GKS7_9BACT|nr:hypothetical protein [Oceaniferula marina]NWK56441.1 hypothetical protein [Oceaniferula marina]